MAASTELRFVPGEMAQRTFHAVAIIQQWAFYELFETEWGEERGAGT